MQTLTYGFIGLGLIGGSIAKAIRKYIPKARIIAYDIKEDSLTLAVQDGVCDLALSSIGPDFLTCDYLFLCAPVAHNASNLALLAPFIGENAILTDVGSVKGDIHSHVKDAGLEHCFIGGHPMAGSERFGYQNAKASLLENAYYILTPGSCVSAEKVEAYRSLVCALGALPLVLDAAEHDYVTAGISHLPHVVAASLVRLVQEHDAKNGIMKLIAAGGFKDITRIASSSAQMWQHICLTNRENISSLLGDYIESLSSIREKIDAADADAIYRFFEAAREYRESFIEASSGPIKKVYTLKADIPDEPGALSAVASTLALHNISIKNIGIVHNREYEEGVLRIEFYEADAVRQALTLLTEKGYNVHT